MLRWSSIFFLLIIPNISWACLYNLELKQLHGLDLDIDHLKIDLYIQMESKGYLFDQNAKVYKAKLIFSKGKDYHAVNKFFAKTSVSFYKNGSMQNYTTGQGKNYSSTQMAYTQQMYENSILKAINHLPDCSN